jgi:hypothetical protein
MTSLLSYKKHELFHLLSLPSQSNNLLHPWKWEQRSEQGYRFGSTCSSKKLPFPWLEQQALPFPFEERSFGQLIQKDLPWP